jgi:hypothetical protein
MCKAGQHWAKSICCFCVRWLATAEHAVLGPGMQIVTSTQCIARAQHRRMLRAQGGQWCQTVSTLEAMQAAGAEPHAAVISSVVDALWHTGIVWAQAKAALLFRDSIRCAGPQAAALQPWG